MSALQVKATLMREGMEMGPKEIRRFRVEEGGSGRFQNLLAGVHSVFNVDSSAQKCTLYWKDEDGDLVQFSTDGELTHALETMREDTFRLYVSLSADTAEDPSTAEASEEEHVIERRVTFDESPQREGCRHVGRREGKAMGGKCGKMMGPQKNKEFQEARQQVPEAYRRWTRNYVRAWYTQGPEAAHTLALNTLPDGLEADFIERAHHFIRRHHLAGSTHGDGEMEMEGELGEGSEGLPPTYHRWLSLFLPRFQARFSRARSASADSGKEERRPRGKGWNRGHKGQGKHGCHKRKGGRHGAQSVTSESEDSDGGQKLWTKVPKEFRRYARITNKQLHKNNGDNSANKEEATRAGLSAEVQDFVDQTVMEWHARLIAQRPCAAAKAMRAGERSLPAGLEQEHFLWLCRFLLRWHRRHAGKCDVMSGWSSGETDDTSGGEDTCPVYGDRHCPRGEGCGRGHKGQGKHGCHKRKGGKHGAQGAASESEDSEGGHKLWTKVPKELRKYARATNREMHKKEGDNSANKEEATLAGLSAEVQDFVDQTVTEWHAKLSAQRPCAVTKTMRAGERSLPAGLEQEHFLWLCRFLLRWHRRHAGKCDIMSGWSSGETDDTSGGEDTCPVRPGHGDRHCPRGEGYSRGHKGQGKHGCHKRKGSKHGAQGGASVSEDSEGGHKLWTKVPKELRKYPRATNREMHKKEGDNSANKEEATRAGLSAEVQDFVDQTVTEWHAKLSAQRPCAVTKAMRAGERSLPAGLEQDHFLWLCHFLLRWHRRHAGKCDVMSGWSSGETDDTSGGEDTCPVGPVHGCGHQQLNRRQLRAIMKIVRGPPHPMMMGPMGHAPYGMAMCPGMGGPCYGPMPAFRWGFRCGAKRCGETRGWGQREGCKRWKQQQGGAEQGEASQLHEESVRRVTEGLKKM